MGRRGELQRLHCVSAKPERVVPEPRRGVLEREALLHSARVERDDRPGDAVLRRDGLLGEHRGRPENAGAHLAAHAGAVPGRDAMVRVDRGRRVVGRASTLPRHRRERPAARRERERADCHRGRRDRPTNHLRTIRHREPTLAPPLLQRQAPRQVSPRAHQPQRLPRLRLSRGAVQPRPPHQLLRLQVLPQAHGPDHPRLRQAVLADEVGQAARTLLPQRRSLAILRPGLLLPPIHRRVPPRRGGRRRASHHHRRHGLSSAGSPAPQRLPPQPRFRRVLSRPPQGSLS
mmetsp:Transcript_10639/g.34034  ORF Transcript_10639/g.34034 Transcript_10639/m.34034 type:complete len:288 (+) Transcript_10639:243-1106(+)